MVGDKRYWEVRLDGGDAMVGWGIPDGVIFRDNICVNSDDEPPRRLVKLDPPPLKRIRPATRMTPLAAKLLAVGMASAQVR